MVNKTQMLKGILEGCVLKLLSTEKLYSQEVSARFSCFGLKDVSDGTLFPLLLRLESEGLIFSEKVPVSNGPARKYYSTTKKGLDELSKFSEAWGELQASVNEILYGGDKDEK